VLNHSYEDPWRSRPHRLRGPGRRRAIILSEIRHKPALYARFPGKKLGKAVDLIVVAAMRVILSLSGVIGIAIGSIPVPPLRRSSMSEVPEPLSSTSRYLGDIAWETEVWCADAPSHLIHFNGERFLGPYNAGD
jgi:hypothetical protein